MYKYILVAAGGIVAGVAAGILIRKIIEQSEKNKISERAKILEECFGEPMFTNTLSMTEVKDWIKAREEKIKSGSKAVVLKVSEKTLHNIGKQLDIGDGVENNIVIAIINSETKKIDDSALIKYEKLDANLESSLSKGNGVLVVEA
ncbi:MAG: hypothetical protein J5590_05220 [Clostridia bacterium]|nr:hypothetical protein [Clostridia bacterium]